MIDSPVRSGLLEFIVDRVNIGLLVVDPDGTIVVFNHFLEAHSGRERSEVVGRNLFDAFPELPRPWLERKIKNVFILKNFAFTSWQQRPYLFRFAHHRTVTSSLDYMRQNCTFIPVLDASSAVTHVCIVVDDATDTSIAQTELERARKEADSANQAKSDFLATMSHEIRTPLSGVIGMNHILLESELTSEQRELAQTTGNCAASLLLLLNDILDFSKIAAGKMELECIDFSLREVMEDALDLVAASAHNKDLEVALVIGEDVPQSVNGDPGRLRQIVLNLLNNAIKFTSKGSVILEVTSPQLPSNDARIRFDVRDTGVGIPADRMDRLFKSFSQVDASTTRKYGGTGLGLAICKRLAGLMNGEVGIESEVNVGSTFWFVVQLAGVPTPAETTIPGNGPFAMRMLIVDDHLVTRRSLRARLEALGAEAIAVANGAEALTCIAQGVKEAKPFEVCLMADSLAERTDPEVLARLAQSQTKFVTLALLGRRNERTETGIPAFATLNKPIRQRQLVECLARLGRVPDTAPQSPQTSRPTGCGIGLRILIAEDNRVIQRIAVRMTENLGFQVDLANNGVEALEAIAKVGYAAVLMDGEMPEMDGFDAARQIRLREQHLGGRVPIIAMTASVMTGDRERFLAAGMDDYITKPISPDRLRDVLMALIERPPNDAL